MPKAPRNTYKAFSNSKTPIFSQGIDFKRTKTYPRIVSNSAQQTHHRTRCLKATELCPKTYSNFCPKIQNSAPGRDQPQPKAPSNSTQGIIKLSPKISSNSTQGIIELYPRHLLHSRQEIIKNLTSKPKSTSAYHFVRKCNDHLDTQNKTPKQVLPFPYIQSDTPA